MSIRLFAWTAVACATFACALPVRAQSIDSLLRRAAEEILRKATSGDSGSTSAGNESSTSSSPSPTIASAASAPPSRFRTVPLETRLGDGPRTLDLRSGTPQELQDRYLPDGALIIVSNPYVPTDRRFIETAKAMACHPQGGLVVYAESDRYDPSPERGRGREYADNGTGLWRVDAEGRVRQFLIPRDLRDSHDERRLCDVPIDRAALEGVSVGGLAFDAAGNLIAVDDTHKVIVRYRTDGRVEHVAGGGPRACKLIPGREDSQRGYRDGRPTEALFSGDLAIGTGRDGDIYVTEDGTTSFGTPGNCDLRRIDPAGNTTTVYGTGRCPSSEEMRTAGHRIPAFDRVVVDAQGHPVVMGADRARREGTGPDVVYTKVHRIEQGNAELLGRAGHGARFDPVGRLVAIGLAPDGTLLAFNAGYYGSAGLIAPTNKPAFSYWWRSEGDMHQPPIDGPRGQARIDNAQDFCAGADGFVYVLTERTVRRIDPRSGAVSTWLQ